MRDTIVPSESGHRTKRRDDPSHVVRLSVESMHVIARSAETIGLDAERTFPRWEPIGRVDDRIVLAGEMIGRDEATISRCEQLIVRHGEVIQPSRSLHWSRRVADRTTWLRRAFR
jgi:hypothetical protein